MFVPVAQLDRAMTF